MVDSDAVGTARRVLGRRLAEERKAAGRTQDSFAPLTGYSRSTLASVETGRQHVYRDFWERCDIALSTGVRFAEGFDQIESLINDERELRERRGRAEREIRANIHRAAAQVLVQPTRPDAAPGPSHAVGARPSTTPPGRSATPDVFTAPTAHGQWSPRPEIPDGSTRLRSLEPVNDHLTALRRVLDAYDLQEDAPTRSVAELQQAVAHVVWMRLESNYSALAVVLPALISELHRALGQHIGQRRAVVAGLLVQAYRAADAIADKLGFIDLSSRIIGMMESAAMDSADELACATTSYVRAEMFFASGEYNTGCRMLVRAADRLDPGLGVDTAAAYGALHMRAAVLAARAGRIQNAHDHVDEAHDIALRVPEGIYGGTVFGAGSVRIHQLTLAIDSDDPDAALRIAERWFPPTSMPAERRSHFYVDLSRAQVRVGAAGQSLASLIEARRIAPEHVKSHPDVHDLFVGDLADGLGRDDRWSEFIHWLRPPS